MRNKYFFIFFFGFLSFMINAQEIIYNQDFEDQKIGTELTKGKLKFQGWNKSVWTVGQEEDNMVATSTTQAKVFLIKSFDVTPGSGPRFPVTPP